MIFTVSGPGALLVLYEIRFSYASVSRPVEAKAEMPLKAI